MRSLKSRAAERAADDGLVGAPAEQATNPFRRPASTQAPPELDRTAIERLISFEASERSTALACLAFGFGAAGYALGFWIAASAEPLLLRIAASIMTGIFIAVLFVVGHDACHGSLSPNPALNKWLGRLALLPSLHPYSAWVYSHNVLHHGWTNLKGRDPVYPPLTIEEYLALPRSRRRLERIHRSIAGVGLLYFNTIWVPYEAFPSAEKLRQINRYGNYAFDRALVIAFALAAISLIVIFSEGPSDAVLGIILAFLAPFAFWNWLIGFVTYLHHTHPSIAWSDDRTKWTFASAQIRGSAHVIFPEFFDALFLRIMHHTAHHAAPGIPFYGLRARQAALDPHAEVYRLTLSACREVFSACQLYDYREQRWLKFPECAVNIGSARDEALTGHGEPMDGGAQVKSRGAVSL